MRKFQYFQNTRYALPPALVLFKLVKDEIPDEGDDAMPRKTD